MRRVLSARAGSRFVGYPNGAKFEVTIGGSQSEIKVIIEADGPAHERAATAAKLKKRGKFVRLLVPAVTDQASDGGRLEIHVFVPDKSSSLMRSKRKRFIF